MNVAARFATEGDVPELVHLYRGLEEEMRPLEEAWPLTDGLAEPIASAFETAIGDPETTVVVGMIDDVPFGFLLARREQMLPQAGGELLGAIRLIFTEIEAREVGIGQAMIELYRDREKDAGIERFDAHVAPGHRLAKNFFESQGFSARRIVMHSG